MRTRKILLLAVMASFALACTPTDESPNEDIQAADQALSEYLGFLHAGEYGQALALAAEDADFWIVLQDNNPDVSSDRVELLRRGCEQQGVCHELRRIVSSEQVNPTEFRIVVEFSLDDGSLFVLGACCGANETEMPPQSQFEFRVVKSGNTFQIYGGPIFVP